MELLILVHCAVAVSIALGGRRLGGWAFCAAAVAPAATLAWLAWNSPGALDGGITSSVSWVPALGLELDLRLDGFGLLMGLVISGIGVLVLAYARWYFASRDDGSKAAALLVAFAGAMFGLVVADNVFVLFGFWELTTVASYLLIGLEDTKAPARASAQQALLVTGAGGLAMLGGLVLLGQAAGTWSLSGILADPPAGGVVPVALGLVLAGAFTKSAQVPFHFWLPGAMAAPTPISAYIHSATMVKAGVYLVALLAPAFAGLVQWWRPVVMGVGLATMVWGAGRALRQNDLKLLAAFSTVSQLGLMVVLFGAGVPALAAAGSVVLLAHSLFKALLFMVVGVVDHHAGTRDIRHLGGLTSRLPAATGLATVAVASMAGIPPLLGFIGKESAYEGFVAQLGEPGWALATAIVVAGSSLTVAYGVRFLWGGFGSLATVVTPFSPGEQVPADRTPGEVGHHETLGSWSLWPPAVMALLTLALGLVPGSLDGLVEGATLSLEGRDTASGGSVHLAIWHGLTPALGLSVVALATGAALVVLRGRLERLQSRFGGFGGGSQAYRWCLRQLLHWADRITGIVQSGSLPTYLVVILATLVLLPAVALVQVRDVDLSVVVAESPLQAVVAGLVIAFALATAAARRRITAVLLVGGLGFGITVLFVVQGAPDLALTQLLVETLSLVMFALVLRRLPDRFRAPRGGLPRPLRAVVAVTVGVVVTAFAVVAASSRTEVPVSHEQIARAEPEGGGRNVVNVIINDIRGLDTLGEITVLVTAALGVAGLAAAARGRSGCGSADDDPASAASAAEVDG